jgi:hypothetical protein
LKAQVSPGAALESFDHKSSVGVGERGQFEFKLGITESACNRGKLRGGGGAIDFCGDDCTIGGIARLVANNDLQ